MPQPETGKIGCVRRSHYDRLSPDQCLLTIKLRFGSIIVLSDVKMSIQ